MRINISNLIFQLLPVAKRQPKRLGILNAITNLHKTWVDYEVWQRKYSRILHASSQKIKLERYLRDVLGCEDIFLRDRGTGLYNSGIEARKVKQ